MASIRLYGDTSGFVELKAPDVADDNVVDLGAVPTVDSTPSDGQVLTWNASLSKWEAKDMKMKEKRAVRFTGNGTWTPPAGVTYAIAYMQGGGGGGGGQFGNGGTGGSSSVAFTSGTVSAVGGKGGGGTNSADFVLGFCLAGPANSGSGGDTNRFQEGRGVSGQPSNGPFGAGGTVTPGVGVSVTVGAGGAAGSGNGRAGGSGYVWIEYYEEV